MYVYTDLNISKASHYSLVSWRCVYSNAEMDDLATHFQLDQDQTQDEWNTLKEALVTSTPDAYQGQRALMKTLLKLRSITGPLRNNEKLCAASLVIPVSNAEVERVFSEMKRIKTDLRNRLQTDTVTQLLTIHRNDRHLNFDSAVNRWHTTKPRRVWRVSYTVFGFVSDSAKNAKTLLHYLFQ